jgi:hypothetical protein
MFISVLKHMKGRIKMANVSIKYKQRGRGKNLKMIRTKPIETLIVINEEKRILKFKSRVIGRICRDLHLNVDKLIEPDINSIDIIKDVGQTNYDV